jgi:hypothetical protein
MKLIKWIGTSDMVKWIAIYLLVVLLVITLVMWWIHNWNVSHL